MQIHFFFKFLVLLIPSSDRFQTVSKSSPSKPSDPFATNEFFIPLPTTLLEYGFPLPAASELTYHVHTERQASTTNPPPSPSHSRRHQPPTVLVPAKTSNGWESTAQLRSNPAATWLNTQDRDHNPPCKCQPVVSFLSPTIPDDPTIPAIPSNTIIV